jgi:S1-C subfamily serine protease
MHGAGERVNLLVLRGSDQRQLQVPLIERPHKTDNLTDLVDPEKNLVRRLGILGIELTLDLARALPDLRIPTGVIVAAKTLGAQQEVPLQSGDVIHAMNGTTITSLAGLREALTKLNLGDPVAVLIERNGQLQYVSFLL